MAIQRTSPAIATRLSWSIALVLGLSFGVGSCASKDATPSATPPTDVSLQPSNPEAPSPEPTALQVDVFTVDEMTGTGCSMALMQSERTPEDAAYIFFNPMQPENTMQMKINGTMHTFERTQGVGAEFYGQFESQTFVNEDTGTTVQVDVRETDTVQIDEGFGVEGTLRVSQEKQEETLSVKGTAGC